MCLHTDGTRKSAQKIQDPRFGASVTALGNLDGDCVLDLAVGGLQDGGGGFKIGAVYAISLHAGGTLKKTHMISKTRGAWLYVLSCDARRRRLVQPVGGGARRLAHTTPCVITLYGLHICARFRAAVILRNVLKHIFW
jgi:hypothetical protein